MKIEMKTIFSPHPSPPPPPLRIVFAITKIEMKLLAMVVIFVIFFFLLHSTQKSYFVIYSWREYLKVFVSIIESVLLHTVSLLELSFWKILRVHVLLRLIIILLLALIHSAAAYLPRVTVILYSLLEFPLLILYIKGRKPPLI